MKNLFFAAAFAAFALTSCGGDDDGQTCITCSGAQVCQGDNGNAFVGGTDTMVSYDVYVAAQAAGACN